MLVKAQIRYHLLQLPVLLFKLLQTPQFAHAQATILLLAVIGLLRDPHLPDHFGYRCPMLSLFQSKGNLLLRKFILHGIIPPPQSFYYARKLTYPLDQFSGGRSTRFSFNISAIVLTRGMNLLPYCTQGFSTKWKVKYAIPNEIVEKIINIAPI